MCSTSIKEIVVAAIDFGTTFSGYAYSLREEYKCDPPKIYTNRWDGEILPKAPTVVLFSSDKKNSYFGFEAEKKYADLISQNEQENWRYFRRFKMDLHRKKKLTRETVIQDKQGRPMPELEVFFAAAIKHLKNYFMEQVKQRVDLKEDEVRWVITVPAIWNDDAKQFMVEAARMAGISDDKLSLAYEPEAVAFSLNNLNLQRFEDQIKLQEFKSFLRDLSFSF